jgi:uncharacterized membrane protein
MGCNIDALIIGRNFFLTMLFHSMTIMVDVIIIMHFHLKFCGCKFLAVDGLSLAGGLQENTRLEAW